MNYMKYCVMEKRREMDLMHHGIDGQKWGVKHGPPYPLDSSKSTGSRLKVKTKKYQDYSEKEQERIKKGAQKGSILGGPIGAAVGMHLSKKHIEQEKAAKKIAKKKAKERENDYKNAMDKYKDPEFRKEKYNRAKNENKWDYMFLEAYSLNGRGHGDGKDTWSDEQALKDYKKYLQDPEKWLNEN